MKSIERTECTSIIKSVIKRTEIIIIVECKDGKHYYVKPFNGDKIKGKRFDDETRYNFCHSKRPFLGSKISEHLKFTKHYEGKIIEGLINKNINGYDYLKITKDYAFWGMEKISHTEKDKFKTNGIEFSSIINYEDILNIIFFDLVLLNSDRKIKNSNLIAPNSTNNIRPLKYLFMMDLDNLFCDVKMTDLENKLKKMIMNHPLTYLLKNKADLFEKQLNLLRQTFGELSFDDLFEGFPKEWGTLDTERSIIEKTQNNIDQITNIISKEF